MKLSKGTSIISRSSMEDGESHYLLINMLIGGDTHPQDPGGRVNSHLTLRRW